MSRRRWAARHGFILLVLVAIAGAASWSCGSTTQVSGDWSGRVAPNHFDYLQLRLTQDGKVIRGTACYELLSAVPPIVVFRDATVSGSYPTLRVSAPGFQGGWTFEGEFQDDGTLSGRYYSGTDSAGYPMILERGIGALGSCVG